MLASRMIVVHGIPVYEVSLITIRIPFRKCAGGGWGGKEVMSKRVNDGALAGTFCAFRARAFPIVHNIDYL